MFIGLLGFFAVVVVIETILIFLIARKTHGFTELIATMRGVPISMFFQDSGYVEWKGIKPEAGIVEHKHLGSFIINERGTYVDRQTKNIFIPFDASVAISLNMRAAQLADALGGVINDDRAMYEFREAVMKGEIADSEYLNCVRDSIQVSAIKSMMNAMIPHNITSKIEKLVAAKLKNLGKVNPWQIVLIFVAMLGAILLGYLIIKLAVPGAGGGGQAAATANAIKETAMGAGFLWMIRRKR